MVDSGVLRRGVQRLAKTDLGFDPTGAAGGRPASIFVDYSSSRSRRSTAPTRPQADSNVYTTLNSDHAAGRGAVAPGRAQSASGSLRRRPDPASLRQGAVIHGRAQTGSCKPVSAPISSQASSTAPCRPSGSPAPRSSPSSTFACGWRPASRPPRRSRDSPVAYTVREASRSGSPRTTSKVSRVHDSPSRRSKNP